MTWNPGNRQDAISTHIMREPNLDVSIRQTVHGRCLHFHIL